MYVTQNDARKILSRFYPGTKIRLTTTTQMMAQPVYSTTPTLAWRKLSPGPASIVHIGEVNRNGTINWQVNYE